MKDIPGYEGLYAVTEKGEIWSHPKLTPVGKNGGFRQDGNKFLNQYTVKSGHLRVYLMGKVMQTHRAVALAYLANPQSLPFVNHRDGDPANNHLSNLEWCSVRYNTKDAFDRGVINMPPQKGAANSNAKLTEEKVKSIRVQHSVSGNCTAIAREYSINPKTVNDIVRRKRWAHI